MYIAHLHIIKVKLKVILLYFYPGYIATSTKVITFTPHLLVVKLHVLHVPKSLNNSFLLESTASLEFKFLFRLFKPSNLEFHQIATA